MLDKLKIGSRIYLVNKDGKVLATGFVTNPCYYSKAILYVEILWEGGGRGFYLRNDKEFWDDRVVLICQ